MANPTALADYDLTPADATQLAKETADFENITADPSAAISRRRALTLALRPKFQEIGQLLKKMDRLVLRFRRLGRLPHHPRPRQCRSRRT